MSAIALGVCPAMAKGGNLAKRIVKKYGGTLFAPSLARVA